MRAAYWRRGARLLTRGVLYLVAGVLAVALGVLVVLESGWGKNAIRTLIVRQANEYLTATLEIGELEGSLLGGLQLNDVRLSRGDDTFITIEAVSLNYS